MANLPENTKYEQFGSSIQTGIKNIAKTIRSLPPKRVDTSKYQGLVNNINPTSFDSKNVTPAPVTKLGTVTVPYGGSTRYEKFHPAVDIANKIGTPLQAFTSGVVTEIKTGYKQGDKGYGNYVIVTDPQGNKHRYSHLEKAFVKVGQPVQRGSVFGTIGNTGSTYSLHGGTGAHLDYRVVDMYNKYVNPSLFIKF